MPYKLVLGESTAEGMRRVAIEQIESALGELDRAGVDPTTGVHRFRRRCKKIRALLRLFRGVLETDGTFQRENASLRDIAGSLSHIRDADVMIKTYDKLMQLYGDELHRPGFAPFRKALTIERRRLGSAFDAGLPTLVEHARLEMVRVRQRAETWSFDTDGFEAIEGGLCKTYARAWKRRREAMAAPTSEGLHEWRKRVKYHRNHLRLICDIWAPMLGPRAQEAEVLAELLGDDHDLAVLREKLVRSHNQFARLSRRREFIALIDRRRDEMFVEIAALGARLFAEKPQQFIRSVRKWWEIWEGGATRLLPSPVARAEQANTGDGVDRPRRTAGPARRAGERPHAAPFRGAPPPVRRR